MFAIFNLVLFVSLILPSLQTEYIKVKWSDNEVFLTEGRSIELSVATVDLSLTCSYPPEQVIWETPKGDRISKDANNVVIISILRLAESGNFTCTNSDTGEYIKIRVIPTGSGLFEICSNNTDDIMLTNGVSVIEPIGSKRVFICLSSVSTPDAANWYFPNRSLITNVLKYSDGMEPGIAVFHALLGIGVHQLRLNGYFDETNTGLYQCRPNVTNENIKIQSVYIYTNETGYIRVTYNQNSVILTTNNSLDIPLGTTMIQLYCPFYNATWLYPESSYIYNNYNSLEVSVFTIESAGNYQCIGNDTVQININGFGQALVGISDNYTRPLSGHESLTYSGVELEILCLSSDDLNSQYNGWHHPTIGRIDTPITRENGNVTVLNNGRSGVYKLVLEGELSLEDEGVYTCGIGDENTATNDLTVGIFTDNNFITVTSFPYEFQVYNRQTIALETNRQSIILSCTYNNTEWLQPPVSSNTLLPDGRILINELTNNSEGEYTCSNATGIEYTTITILQGSQQIQISVDGVIFDDSLLTIYPCAHPKLITCSITDNIHDTHLLLYSAYSRGVISHNVSSAVLDTSVLRATDSGVYICGTDVLGYAVSVEIQLDILQANYILLEYGTKSLPLVNGQTVNLDPLTSAIVLSCQGTLPHWQSYPTSNTTQLVNDSTSLYLDLSNSQADGEYLCIDNSTGEITLISITTDYTVGMEVTESELQITEYIQIENLDTSVYVQSGDYPIIPYGTLGIKLSCSLQGLISWRYQQGSDGVCLIPGGILIRTIDSYTRGEYSCSNGDNTISISLNNIIQLTQLYTSQISAGYNSISIPVFSRNITLSCDSSDPAWLLNFTLNNSTIRIDSSDYQCNINGMLIRVYDGVIYFDSFGLFESGYYTCDPETSRQTTVYLQSSVRIDVTQDGVIQTFIGNDNITIHVSATGILISCITGSDNAELRSFGVPSNGLNILNDSSTVINYFWNRSPYQFSCSDSVYPLSSNATVNIITEGLELFANFSTSPIKISTNSILLQSPATTLSLTCLYGSINTPPILTYRNLSNYVTPFSANVQTQINLNGLEINITASYINFTTAIAKNSIAINGNYACVGSQNELINFTVYHVQSVTPRIVFYRNFSLTSLRVISSPLSGINDILECRAEILETTILVEKVEWLLNGVPFLDDVGSLLNLSSLQPQTAEYECRAYSRFFNVSRIIRVTIQGVPTAPINLSVSEITTSSAVLSWKFASISQNTGITAYQIEYTTIQNPSNTIYATSTSMSVLLQTLKPFTQYSVRVRARNFYGYGDYSDNVIFHTQHAGQIISNLTNTSVIISLITPIPSDAIIQSYRITISGAKLYDLDYTETRNAILVNSSVTQLKLDELTPDTLYTLIIVSLDSMGVFLTTTSVSVHTEPGVLNVTNPVIWSTPLRGLQSILLNLEGTSNRNAEILYHLLFMVEVPVSFDTDLFDIIAFLTNGKSRNSRDTSALKSVIQLSIVANISTQTCDSFPNFLLIGDNRGITPCDFSQLQNLTNYTDKIQTDFSPELEFNYKYAFVLTASTRNEIIYYSPVSEFISLLPEETDGFDFGIIYTIVAVGIVFILFLLSVLLIYCLIRFGRKLFKKRRSPPKQEESQMLAAIDLSLTTSKGSIAFVNPLFKTLEEPNRIPISLAPFEELAKNTFCIKSEFVIHIDEFGEHVRELHDNFNQGFTQEYNRLYERRQSDAIVAQKPCNRHLNRFVDIFPYDDSRVVLTPISESDHDYINASFLNGYDRERNYIATQAPFMDMIVDFWRQCWEYNIAVIALLTDSIEGRKTRNYYYWPEDLTTEISFGPFVIKLTDILIKPSFIRRALLLKVKFSLLLLRFP
ncbi:Receptor-type tyrosine-protein phosphatase F isoform X1 [Oopsacas minuta]|uniref:Receptor-type tyrosine-protein phosphatase F isoform X1 n=1 Tax=Oopsacas minuta TaxID=111878 RepID=A0AAV7JMS2_9METZ|nr:Receptor-type tyrosine-protein phosphatase F isoform X1 [Oopsacas minuta]